MMALLMGVRSPSGLARATDLGVAMQLSNIARDVGEDARQGRLYLPRQWLREAGIDPDTWLARPTHSPALAEVVRRLLDEADALYARVDAGVAELPADCRTGIHAARTLYAAIGHQVARNGFNPLAGRAVVPPARKAQLLAKAVLRRRFDTRALGEPPLAANRFLVEAAANTRAPQPRPRGLQERGVWLYQLFDKLGRMDSGQRLDA
jgi:15-cis-phytoene synthase